MQQLSSELLLNIFKRFDSLEMVLVMCVCKDWLEIIDDNKTLWRNLVLPKRENGWSISTVELFDRKSNSSLKEVEIQIDLKEGEVDSLKDLLEKSKATLQTLYLSGLELQSMDVQVLEDLCWTLANLTSFRILNYDSSLHVNLIEHEMSREEGKGFKILWVYTTKTIEEAFSRDPHRFDHLVSLRIKDWIYPSGLITILKRCSQALKHLSIPLNDGDGSQSFATVNLNLLEVLELALDYPNVFPSWLRIPSSCTLINYFSVSSSLPQIDKLWLRNLVGIQRLTINCPHLVELRVVTRKAYLLSQTECDDLINTLRQRSNYVNAGMEIKGVKIIHLKRLIFPFEFLSQRQLLQLEDLVEELVDLESVERLIEVEV